MHAILLLLLNPVLLFAQDAKTTALVTPNLAEIRVPLEQPANSTWKWNRAETSDNDCEYMWQVSVANGGARYSFGFYLYKFPGSKPANGDLHALFTAGQASVFREDATKSQGDLIREARIDVSTEAGKIVIRVRDAELIRTMFSNRPETVTINTRAIGSNFEVAKVEYRD